LRESVENDKTKEAANVDGNPTNRDDLNNAGHETDRTMGKE
jgi:hypothetical protein